MLTSALFTLLLPALAAAAPVSPADIASLRTVETENLTPAAALEASFKAVHDAHHAAKASSNGDVQVLGDIFNGDIPAGVVVTRNELIEGKCAPIIVIFARGTTEPGNVGDDVGPSFFDNLELLEPGRVVVQGVNNYPASVWGYLGGGSDDGAANMAASVKLASTQCPTSKVVLSGFSQGAQVTHKAAKLLATSLYKFVGAIVLFGDPNNGDAFPGTLNTNVKTFCYEDDLICDGLPIPLGSHADYENEGPAAAAYVAKLL